MVNETVNINKYKNMFCVTGILFASIIVFIIVSLVSAHDCDYLWHTALYRYMRNNGSIFSQDVFSWRAAEMGYSEIAHSWLGSYIIGFIVNFFVNIGLPEHVAFYFFSIPFFLVACILFYIYFYRPLFKQVDLFYFIICVTLTFLFTNPRPQNISHCLIIWAIGICFKLRSDINSKQFLLFPVISLVWANVHGGSIVLYFAILFGFLAVSLLSNVKLGRFSFYFDDVKYVVAKKMSIGLVSSVVTSFINPYGYKLFSYFLHVSNDNFSKLYVSEWQSISSQDTFGLVLLALLFVPMFIYFELDAVKYCFTAGCLSLCLKYVRFEHYAIIFGIILLCDYYAKYKEYVAAKESSDAKNSNFLESKRNRVLVIIALVTVVVFVTGLCVSTVKFFVNAVVTNDVTDVTDSSDIPLSSVSVTNQIGYIDLNVVEDDNDILDVDLVSYLKKLKDLGFSDRLFCSYDTGSKLIYAGIPSFIDARADLFVGDELLDGMTMLTMDGYAEDIDVLLDKYAFDSFIIEKPSYYGFQEYLLGTGDWKIGYSDNNYNVYIKNNINVD